LMIARNERWARERLGRRRRFVVALRAIRRERRQPRRSTIAVLRVRDGCAVRRFRTPLIRHQHSGRARHELTRDPPAIPRERSASYGGSCRARTDRRRRTSHRRGPRHSSTREIFPRRPERHRGWRARQRAQRRVGAPFDLRRAVRLSTTRAGDGSANLSGIHAVIVSRERNVLRCYQTVRHRPPFSSKLQPCPERRPAPIGSAGGRPRRPRRQLGRLRTEAPTAAAS